MYESLLHGSVSTTYNDMLSAAQKAKKSLSAWSLASKLTGSHMSLSSKQKKLPTEETHGERDVAIADFYLFFIDFTVRHVKVFYHGV